MARWHDNLETVVVDHELTAPVFTIDSFAEKAFGGNPCSVVLLPLSGLPDHTLQSVAAEMNLSETAFITQSEPPASGYARGFVEGNRFGLRWFTPTCEVPLCGHGTMAAAAALIAVGNRRKTIFFSTASGDLAVTADPEFNPPQISMVLPRNSPRKVPDDEVAGKPWGVLCSLVVGELPVQEVLHSAATKKMVIRLADTVSRIELEALKPDTIAMTASHDGTDVRGVIVTVRSSAEDEFDFLSRYFAPWNGIPEDPVTGSAHTVLAPYWSNVLGKPDLMGRQCSRRGGNLTLAVDQDKVTISGRACVVLEGTLRLGVDASC